MTREQLIETYYRIHCETYLIPEWSKQFATGLSDGFATQSAQFRRRNVSLFLGHEPYRYGSFASMLEEKLSERSVFYVQVERGNSSGFPFNRSDSLMTFDNMVDRMAATETGTVVTSRIILSVTSQLTYNLFGLLSDLGIKCFVVENDPAETRPTFPALRGIANNFERRFCLWPALTKPWDKEFGISNTLYGPIMQDYGQQNITGADINCDIIMASNLRLGEHKAKGTIPHAIKLIERFGLDKFINEAPRWYLEMRQTVFDSDETLITKIDKLHTLYLVYTTACDLFKIEIAGWLADNPRFKIYGDEMWKRFYPDKYCGYIRLDDMPVLLSRPCIFILPNLNLGYDDAFGPLYDMVRWQRNFLHPSVCVGQNIESIEFSTEEELKDRLASMPSDQWNATTELMDLRARYKSEVETVVDIISTAARNGNNQ